MDSICVFARVEKKYLLTREQAARVQSALAVRGYTQGQYGHSLIQSLYYDTPDCLLTRRSLDRPLYKEKLRFRTYGVASAQGASFVEIKKKYKGVVYKRRIELPYAQAVQALAQGAVPASTGQIGREINWMLQSYGLAPRALIMYDRDAFTSEAQPDVRVTFDSAVRCRTWEMDLRLPPYGHLLTGRDEVLMEIKIPGVYPLWLLHILESVGAQQVHFSKIGTAYQRMMAGQTDKSERKVLYSA